MQLKQVHLYRFLIDLSNFKMLFLLDHTENF